MALNVSASRNGVQGDRKMHRPLALVFGGGGARGALQVGAVRALWEAGIRPDVLTGTSVGAANATYLAIHGLSLEAIEGLEKIWRIAAAADLLPANYLWLTLRVLFNRSGWDPYHRLREFFITQGLSPDLRFGDIRGVRLILVAADLNAGRPVLYGQDPRQSVLEGLLASTALPPFVHPLERGEQLLIDGGVVSNLPVEAALQQGARTIIALDIADPRVAPVGGQRFGPFLGKLTYTVERRQTDLEIALARSQGALVREIVLRGEVPIPVWDFSHTDELIARGYETACREIARWRSEQPVLQAGWLGRLLSFDRRGKGGDRG